MDSVVEMSSGLVMIVLKEFDIGHAHVAVPNIDQHTTPNQPPLEVQLRWKYYFFCMICAWQESDEEDGDAWEAEQQIVTIIGQVEQGSCVYLFIFSKRNYVLLLTI